MIKLLLGALISALVVSQAQRAKKDTSAEIVQKHGIFQINDNNWKAKLMDKGANPNIFVVF